MLLSNGVAAGRDRFAEVLPVTLRYEGGYSNDPHDPGGPTMKGVIQRVYDGYRDGRGQPRQSVRRISDAEVLDIYRANYWNLVRGDELPPGLDLAVFDFGVNSGPATATRKLQAVLGLRQDGMMGAATLAEAARRDPVWLIRQYIQARRAYLRSLPTFWRFGEGWMSRCEDLEHQSLAAVGHGDMPNEPVALFSDPDEQSASQGRAYEQQPRPPMATEIGLAGSGSGSLAVAAPNVISRALETGRITFTSLLMALASEPLFWAGMALLWGGVATWIYRRRHLA